MEFLSSKFLTGLTPALFSLIGVAALILWWIIRKKVKRIWLPTVRILNLPKKSLPKITQVVPPLIPFVCFLIGCIGLFLFCFQPQKIVQIETNNKQQTHHIFIDLSPSHSAVATLENIQLTVKRLYKNFSKRVSITISDSSSPTIRDVGSENDLDQYLSTIQFHREGLKLGQNIRSRFESLGEVDRIYFVSDKDFHSWSDFQWQYLLDRVDIYRIETGDKKSAPNLFINNVTNVSEKLSDKAEWEVELARAQSTGGTSGTLEVLKKDKVLTKEKWSFPDDENQIRFRVSWFNDRALRSKENLEFRIIPTGEDSILADNSFRVESERNGSKVLVIADQGGELQLEDPAYHLIGSLEVLGFKIDRLDHIQQTDLELSDYTLVIMAAGTGNGIADYCPYQFTKDLQKEGSKIPKIWIYPISQNANYSEMCHCLSLLKNSPSQNTTKPDYCSESVSRNSWSYLLKSIGGKAVGGEIDVDDTSAAWILKNNALNMEVLAFSLPLNPRVKGGVGFAQFPLFIRSLLDWQNLINDPHRTSLKWPRIEDISLYYNKKIAKQSNVPYGESSLREVPKEQLPELWKEIDVEEFKTSFTRKQAFTPEPWIRSIFLIVLLIVLLELIYSVINALKTRRKTFSAKQLILFFVIGSSITPTQTEAQVTVNALGYRGNETSSHLSFEISSRTSIELKPRMQHHSTLSKQTLSDPWIWTHKLSDLTDANGKFKIEIVNWIKKGGFLVIENVKDTGELNLAIKDHFSHHSFTPEWKPIPPDHEIMRSFYLLDSLPQCSGGSWQGFIFDDRLAILVIPFRFLESLSDNPSVQECKSSLNREQMVRTFVNILMVAMATDYKKDQIHLPEILKRLR